MATFSKQYAEICQADGVSFTASNIVHDFEDCIDGLVMLDMQKLKPKKRAP